MRNRFCLYFTLVIYLSFAGNVYAQQQQSGEIDSHRKNVVIELTYNETGELSKLILKPSKVNNNDGCDSLIIKEDADHIIEKFFPTDERGRLVATPKMSFGHAGGKFLWYEKVKIDYTLLHRWSCVGVTYVIVTKQ